MSTEFMRSKIRHKVKDLLSGKTIAKDRVFSNRVKNLNDYELPLIIIKTDLEKNREFSQSPKILERSLNLTVEAHIKAEDRIDDRLDFIASQIENAMTEDFSLEGLASDSMLYQTEIHVDSESDSTYGAVDLIYFVKYHTDEGGNL